jgi:hypothetical protein
MTGKGAKRNGKSRPKAERQLSGEKGKKPPFENSRFYYSSLATVLRLVSLYLGG